MNLKHRQFEFHTKSIDDSGSFSGYGSVFGNADLYGDVVMPGAFQKSLAAWGAKNRLPPILWQHDSKQPIGAFTTMTEDAKGLFVEGKLLTKQVQRAGEAHALMQAKAINGMSIGYNVVQAQPDRESKVLRLNELDLWEVSIVTFPANTEAIVQSVKSIADLSYDELEQALRQMYPGTPRRLAAKIANACFKELDKADPGELELAAALKSLKQTLQR